MEQRSERLWTLAREPVGPLVGYLDGFANELLEQGFKVRALGPQIRFVAKFSRWLKANHVSIDRLGEEHTHRFLKHQNQRTITVYGYGASLHRFMTFLRKQKVIGDQTLLHESTPIEKITGEFATHLLQDQCLSKATRVQYVPFIERFLSERFGNKAVDLSTVCARDVVEFVKRRAACLNQARAKSATTALRSFLRYLRMQGVIRLDLAAAVPTVPNWSMSAIPRAIAPEHLRSVLASCRRDTHVGCRDYAILLLIARLGLRSGEVIRLTLDSIEWSSGRLTVIGSKGAQRAELPLPQEIGEAIAQYLRRWRPKCNSRVLFVRVTAPIGGLAPQTIGSIVGAALARAGIETRHRGAHQFRHALASEMLRRGASFAEIGSLLRHRHPKTTGIYAKVDFAALRSLSIPWPGGVQ